MIWCNFFLCTLSVLAWFLVLGMTIAILESFYLGSQAQELTVFSYTVSIIFLAGFAYDAYIEAKEMNGK